MANRKAVYRRALFRITCAIAVGGPIFALLSGPAAAEVQKVIFVCVHGRVKQPCPQYRASLHAPEGWTEDRIAEARQGRVIYVPKGKTYETAPLAISVQTVPNKGKTSIDVLTQRDQDAFRQEHKDATIVPLPAIVSDTLGTVKLHRIVAPDLKPRPAQITARFADKDGDGEAFSIDVTASALTERGLGEVKPKLDQMIKGY